MLKNIEKGFKKMSAYPAFTNKINELYNSKKIKENWGYEHICKELKVSQGTFNGWLDGNMPKLEHLKAICKLFDVSEYELLGLKEPKEGDIFLDYTILKAKYEQIKEDYEALIGKKKSKDDDGDTKRASNGQG